MSSRADRPVMSVYQAKRRLLEFGVLADRREQEARKRMGVWAIAASVLGGAGTFMSLASLFKRGGDDGEGGGGRKRGKAEGLVRQAVGIAVPMAIKFVMGKMGRDQRGW